MSLGQDLDEYANALLPTYRLNEFFNPSVFYGYTFEEHWNLPFTFIIYLSFISFTFHLQHFLVACTHLYKSLCPLVCWLVGRSHFTFFYDFISLTHCTWPNGLVTSTMAPAHTHATSEAMYPALFFSFLFSCIEILLSYFSSWLICNKYRTTFACLTISCQKLDIIEGSIVVHLLNIQQSYLCAGSNMTWPKCLLYFLLWKQWKIEKE